MNSFHEPGDRRYTRYDTPKDEWSADTHQMPAPLRSSDELRAYVRIFTGRIRLVGAVAVCGLLLALCYIWLTTPLYSSTTELLIDPRRKQTVEGEVSPSGLGSSAVGADTLLLDSQIEVLNSHSVTERLILEEGLTEDREFVGDSSSGLVLLVKNLVKTVLYGPHEATWLSTNPHDRALKTLRKRVSIKRQRNTYVIGIRVLTADAEKSARIANRIARIYMEETDIAASLSTRETVSNLESRLMELRSAAQRSESQVEAYKSDNGLIGTQDVLIVEQQLRDLNDQLSRARANSQSAFAFYNQVKTAGATGNPATSIGEVAASPVMSELQTSLAELNSEEADLLATHLPQHPSLKRLRDRKQAVRESISREYQRILGRLDVRYKSASETVASLSKEVASLEARVAASNSATVELRELEREAEASRKVYQSFLGRSKEAYEQIGLPKSTARIISLAYPASRPAYPKPLLILGGSLIAAIMAGLLLAWVQHIFGIEPKPTRTSPGQRPLSRSLLDYASRTAR